MARNLLLAFTATLVLASTALSARLFMPHVIDKQAKAGQVNLPYSMRSSDGNQWFVYNGGWVQNQGNRPVFSQGGILYVNGSSMSGDNNGTKLKNGDLVLENMRVREFQVTRYITMMEKENLIRMVDVIHNPNANDTNAQIRLQTSMNYGVNSASFIDDKRSKQKLAWVANTGAQQTAFTIFSGEGSKQQFTIDYRPNNSYCRANLTVKIPGKGSVAVMHVHGITPDEATAEKQVKSLRSKLLKGLSPKVRRLLVNFRSGNLFVGDLELLRGEAFDMVELRSGDRLRGDLQHKRFVLDTFYGKVDLPADKVVGFFNIGSFRPEQLVVTVNGEIFGGQLQQETVDLKLSSGQVINIPLTQIIRGGYRKGADEPEEWEFKKPMVLLRSGDRMEIKPTKEVILVASRYGTLSLKPEAIATIVFQTDEQPVHQITLADGSRFAGLVSAASFTYPLSGTATSAEVKFPTSAMQVLQMKPVEEQKADTPTLNLISGDMLVGALQGELQLQTSFDAIKIGGSEIARLERIADSHKDVKVELWDKTTVSGTLKADSLTVKLVSGIELSVPVAQVSDYMQPLPTPSNEVENKIRELVKKLDADDWKTREQAEREIVAMGVAVVKILKELQADASPEAQQRIEGILKELGKDTRDDEEKSSDAKKKAPPILIEPVDIRLKGHRNAQPQFGGGELILNNKVINVQNGPVLDLLLEQRGCGAAEIDPVNR